jgi:hypothetical protein
MLASIFSSGRVGKRLEGLSSSLERQGTVQPHDRGRGQERAGIRDRFLFLFRLFLLLLLLDRILVFFIFVLIALGFRRRPHLNPTHQLPVEIDRIRTAHEHDDLHPLA